MKKLIIAVLVLFALSSVGFAQAKKELPKTETKGTASMVSNNAKAQSSNAVAHKKSKAHQKAVARHHRMTKQANSSKKAKLGAKKPATGKKLIKTASRHSKKNKEVRERSMKRS
jgi:hypothetical protein